MEEPAMFTKHINSMTTLTEFLNFCVRRDASDIFLQNGETARIQANGCLETITNFKFQTEQIEQIASLVAEGQNLTTAIASGRDFDHAFSVEDLHNTNARGTSRRLRFRLNATGIVGRDSSSKQLVMRYISEEPPTLDGIGFPDDLKKEIGLQQGMFLIAGETGSGKSSTFAACLRYILEGNTEITGNILTFEAPVEFVFADIRSETCICAQTEIGVSLPNFSAGIRNAMRRKPALIVVGEMRDTETIRAANDAAITGHPLYSTVHARNSAAIIRRMVGQYSFDQRSQAYAEIVENCRILMSQTLVPRIGGGRICLRDWCVIDPSRSEVLLNAGQDRHVEVIQKWMEEGDRAQSMKTTIEIELGLGTISHETAQLALKKYGYVV